MNSTFKVVFNKARGALMVVNEATSSVQAKGTKTVIAAAVTALMAGGAMAGDLTYDSIVKNEQTFKFLNGKGEVTNIKTNADANKLFSDLAAAGTDIKKILVALGQVNEDKKTGIVFGYAGGQNQFDTSTKGQMFWIKTGISVVKPELNDTVNKIDKQFSGAVPIFEGATHTIIGANDGKTSPVVIGMVGADRVLNAALDIALPKAGEDPNFKIENTVTEVTRVGDSMVDVVSGNVFGLTNAGSAINIGSIVILNKKNINIPFLGTRDVYVKPSAEKTSYTLEGNSILNVTGTGCVGGAVVGGSAVAIGGESFSTVTGGTSLTINNSGSNEANSNINSLNVGLAAGGLAVATMGGNSTAVVNDHTNVNLEDGLVIGVMGGGIAAAADPTDVFQKLNGNLGNLSDNISWTEGIDKKAGTALAESQNITINVGDKATAFGVIGGGLAGSYQYGDATTPAHSATTAKNVTINLGSTVGSTPELNRQELINTVRTFGNAVSDFISSMDLGQLKDAGLTFAKDVDDYQGVTVGVLGGGAALAYDRNRGGNTEPGHTASASSTVDSVTVNVSNGYNVALVGGGLAAGSGHADPKNNPLATANVTGKVEMTFGGGETIGVMGGGAAIWAGQAEKHTEIGAQANVESVKLNVVGGSVDGLFGGGLAVDDSNPKVNGIYVDARNAEANVGNVNINVAGGKVGRLHVEAFNKIDNYPSGEGQARPDMKLYLKAGLKAIQDGKAAIVGGGMAAGNSIAIGEGVTAKDAAGARVEVANINISGGEIGEDKNGMQGNIYGGGIASTGGTTWVGTSNITVGGGTIHGDIYGGGLSIGGNYGEGHECYNDALSAVDTTNITLVAGSLNGNVYLGGRVLEEGAKNKGKAHATVAAGTLTIYKDFKFLKADAVIDGSGADSATLNFVNGYDFSKAEASEIALLDGSGRIVIKGFDKLESGDLVTGADYDMGGKSKVEVTGNYEFTKIKNGTNGEMIVKDGGALAVQSGEAIDNKFVVEEGVLALGTTARTADARDGLGKYNEKAGLYLSGTVDLVSAKINVGNVAADVKTNVNLGSNGTLIVDATAPKEDALATTVTGTINAVEGSTLHYVNVADQGIVTVDVDGKVKTTVDNLLFKVVEVGSGHNQFTFERATTSDLAGTGLGGFDGDALVGMAENEVIGSLLDEANTAITSGSQREARLNGALNIAAAGGVQTAGIEAATMGIDQATKRAALTNVFTDGWTGFAEVTGTSLKMGGDSGALETKTELGGITVGGEYTMGDMTFGVMGNFGTGDVEGEGDNNGAKNDVDYYGVQGYAAKRMGQFNLVGQMGLMTTKNDVTSADGDSADIDATIFTIGARGEMAFQLSKSCQAVPYVGLNYLRVATDGYNTAKGLSVDDMDQNLVSMPIGVAFSGNMDLASGWTLRPTVDVAYVHTFGDTDVEATTKFGAAAINTNLDVWSENVGRVGFGLEARKDALSFGGRIGGAFGDNDHREFYGQLNVKYLF